MLLVNIPCHCWICKGVDLAQIASVKVTVGQIPFNFQIGKDAAGIPLAKPATRDGELELRLDNCEGPPLVSASLAPAAGNHGLTLLPPITLGKTEGKHDICFKFTRAKIDPIWVIGGVELVAR